MDHKESFSKWTQIILVTLVVLTIATSVGGSNNDGVKSFGCCTRANLYDHAIQTAIVQIDEGDIKAARATLAEVTNEE